MTSGYRTTPSLVFLFCLLLPSAVQAQVFPRGNGTSLTGLHQADIYVNVSGWVDIPREPATFRLDTQRIFERELTSYGISRRPADRHYLVCNVQAMAKGTHVTYTTTVELWNLRSTDVHTLLWNDGALSSIERERFSAEVVAGDCARSFLTEWNRWNQS